MCWLLAACGLRLDCMVVGVVVDFILLALFGIAYGLVDCVAWMCCLWLCCLLGDLIVVMVVDDLIM